MEYFILGFFTGLSLILAIGAQNIFVMEQGLKKQHIFIICFICAISDLILIFLGIFLFEFFKEFFNYQVELIFNILLFIFLIYFILGKIKYTGGDVEVDTSKKISLKKAIIKTIAFTYLNPHVYSDTVFFLGNFSKNFLITDKYYFGLGASIASFLFFYCLGYLSKYLSRFIQKPTTWRLINIFIISFMTLIALYVLNQIFNFY